MNIGGLHVLEDLANPVVQALAVDTKYILERINLSLDKAVTVVASRSGLSRSYAMQSCFNATAWSILLMAVY